MSDIFKAYCKKKCILFMIRGKCKLVGILLELKLYMLCIWEQMDMLPRKRIEASLDLSSTSCLDSCGRVPASVSALAEQW